MYTILSILFIASGLLLILFILLRKGEGGGLSGAFGGMGGDTAFGVKAAKHLDRIIAIVACVFLGSAILMSTKMLRKQPSRTAPEVRKEKPSDLPAPPIPSETESPESAPPGKTPVRDSE